MKNTKKIIIEVIFTIAFLAIWFLVQNKKQPSSVSTFFAMDTYMSISATGKGADEAIADCIEKINYLDSILNADNENSDIFAMNMGKDITPSKDTEALIAFADEISALTDYNYYPYIYPLTKAWGFTSGDYRVPDSSEINLIINTFPINNPDASVPLSYDLGGIAKGYATDSVLDVLKEHGIKSAMINLGGNIYALGKKNGNNPWDVAVKNPESNENYLGILHISDKCVITSGGYERFFEEDGKTYHHILDPRTGYPADSNLLSVTIVNDNPTLADALSTALFVMGEDKAVEFWKAHSDLFDCILMNKDSEISITEGIKNEFTSEYAYKTLTK